MQEKSPKGKHRYLRSKNIELDNDGTMEGQKKVYGIYHYHLVNSKWINWIPWSLNFQLIYQTKKLSIF